MGDEGGNTIIVHWYTRKANLYHVWDTSIIQSSMGTFYDSDLTMMINTNSIWSNLMDNQLPLWVDCRDNGTVCSNRFASESISLEWKYTYRNATPGHTLKDKYLCNKLYPVVTIPIPPLNGLVRTAFLFPCTVKKEWRRIQLGISLMF